MAVGKIRADKRYPGKLARIRKYAPIEVHAVCPKMGIQTVRNEKKISKKLKKSPIKISTQYVVRKSRVLPERFAMALTTVAYYTGGMTDIPGTAMPKPVASQPTQSSKTKMPLAPLPVHEDELLVTNPEEQKRTDVKNKDVEEYFPWYQTLLAWMSFGTVLGILASIIGFKVQNLLILAPLGPTVGAIAWYVRRFATKNLKKFDGMA